MHDDYYYRVFPFYCYYGVKANGVDGGDDDISTKFFCESRRNGRKIKGKEWRGVRDQLDFSQEVSRGINGGEKKRERKTQLEYRAEKILKQKLCVLKESRREFILCLR